MFVVKMLFNVLVRRQNHCSSLCDFDHAWEAAAVLSKRKKAFRSKRNCCAFSHTV